jgi:FecR protein
MRYLNLKLSACLLGAAALVVPAWGMDSNRPATAYPGTLNYVEGQASIGSETLNSQSIGSAQLEPGQSLTTENGKAEVLLIPGVFLRVGADSSVQMISPSLTNTEVLLQKGEATVEVTELHKENRLRMDENGTVTELVKTGFYDFDANQNQIRVFDGQAMVKDNDREIRVKGGHELELNASKLKPHGFDKKEYEASDLYNWSSLRSAYVAEANADIAPRYVLAGGFGPGWIGAGWYWDPWFSCYTFLPGDGIFYSPFGWGFYSPFWAYNYFGGFYGPHYFHRFSADPHAWGPGLGNTPTLRAGGFRGLSPSSPLMSNPRGFGTFHGAASGSFRDGGVHEGGGFEGFHGGGFGGFRGGPGR